MADDQDFVIPRSLCPQCRYGMDRTSQACGTGDFSICINCGLLLVFEADLTLRKPAAEELRELMNDDKAWTVVKLTQRFIYGRGRLRIQEN